MSTKVSSQCSITVHKTKEQSYLYRNLSFGVRCCTPLSIMYHSPVVQRSPTEEDDRLRRDSLAGAGVQQHPHYDGRSPTHAHLHSYSPTNGSHSQGTYNGYSSRPSTAAAVPLPSGIGQSPRLGPPPSPTLNGFSHMKQSGYLLRDTGASTYYDPTSEHREGSVNWGHSAYSPVQVRRILCEGMVHHFIRLTAFYY